MQITDKIQVFNSKFEDLMPTLADGSLDIILEDPPYLYLKHELDKKFDEELHFKECHRVLAKGGFLIVFGRGASFYRWGAILDRLGFEFKEEIIWDKSQCSSPLMALSRVHETISIWSKGKGSINKCKIPYLEMKGHDVDSICDDIKRMRSILKNTKSLNAVLDFLENNNQGFNLTQSVKHKIQVEGHTKDRDRTIKVLNGIKNGLNEKTIIRTDRVDQEAFTKHSVTSDKRQKGDRSADVMQGIQIGLTEKSIIKPFQDQGVTISSDKVGKVPDSVVDMNKILNGMSEKSIIQLDQQISFIKTYYKELLDLLLESGQTTIYEELRDHYTSIHPTQKPVRLLERLLQLVIPKNKSIVRVGDFFGGSYSTMKACHNLGLHGIGCEMNPVFHDPAIIGLIEYCRQLNIFSA